MELEEAGFLYKMPEFGATANSEEMNENSSQIHPEKIVEQNSTQPRKRTQSEKFVLLYCQQCCGLPTDVCFSTKRHRRQLQKLTAQEVRDIILRSEKPKVAENVEPVKVSKNVLR